MAWDKVVWIHPVKRRFNVRTGLSGKTLTQELTGSQTRMMLARGANQAEYALLVQEHEETEFVAEYDFSADVTFRHGYESFNVNVSGSRLVPAEQGSNADKEGSYTYSPASAIIT